MVKKLIFIFLIIFSCHPVFASDVCSFKHTPVVFKINSDGTFIISSGESFRFLGIKTPNETGDYGKNKLESYLRERIFKKHIRIVCDSDLPDTISRDEKYNNLVYVYLEDGTFINAEIIKEGLAIVDYNFYFKYLKQLEDMEMQASERKNGLWQIPIMEILTWRSRKVDTTYILADIQNKSKSSNKKEADVKTPESRVSEIESDKKKRLSKYIDVIQKFNTTLQEDIDKSADVDKKDENSISIIIDNPDEKPIPIYLTPQNDKKFVNFIGHNKLKVYHTSNCKKIKWIKSEKVFFNTGDEAEKAGFKPCIECLNK